MIKRNTQRILQANDISKTFKSGDRNLTVLSDINFTIQEGESVSIVGPSGSGKTTLLGLCAGLDRPTEGQMHIYDKEVSQMDENAKAAIRNEYVGFIFQNFQLIPTLTALENVMIPLELQGKSTEAKIKAKELLDRVGLKDRMGHYPSQLSGGEQQRVSLARAFSNTPKLLFADEPTGNLDGETGANVEQLLFDLNREQGTTLIIVTHDLDLARRTKRIIKLKSGKIIEDILNQPVV
ncbi:MAG: putative ABC transport system ATP-binding protein [Saprospiraceae bacterium]|jgi:putative ABC transport system ATP-binding protein